MISYLSSRYSFSPSFKQRDRAIRAVVAIALSLVVVNVYTLVTPSRSALLACIEVSRVNIAFIVAPSLHTVSNPPSPSDTLDLSKIINCSVIASNKLINYTFLYAFNLVANADFQLATLPLESVAFVYEYPPNDSDT